MSSASLAFYGLEPEAYEPAEDTLESFLSCLRTALGTSLRKSSADGRTWIDKLFFSHHIYLTDTRVCFYDSTLGFTGLGRGKRHWAPASRTSSADTEDLD